MSEVTTTKLKEDKCPSCAGRLSAASGFHDHLPKPGDITICGYCASVLQFGEDLKVQILTKDQWDTELDEDTKAEIQHIVHFVKHKLALRPHHQN